MGNAIIIQHNMASMGAFRQAKIISDRKAKTSERLASGYRINRASDDAAGLSISQKMRAQIRGLNRANHNIQEGINFVQVGEGGMQEVHDIVQRIRELSVQAANDTNTLADRAAIQQEIDALSGEINGIAYGTSFNNHYMLRGQATETASGGNAGGGNGGGGTGSGMDSVVSDALAKRVTYGGSGNDSMANAVRNPDGTIVFCGATTSADKDLDGIGSATQSGWATKIGTDGEILWTTAVSESGKAISFSSITATADGGYFAAGGSSGSPFLAKLDADGNVAWTYRFSCGSSTDNNANGALLMQDGSGHILLSIQAKAQDGIKDGRNPAKPLGGTTLWSRDVIMMVIDPAVNPNDNYDAFEKKAYRVGGDGNEQIAQLFPTSDGGYIGGDYTTSTPFNNATIVQSNRDGTQTTPQTSIVGTGSHEAFITKFDKNGDVEKVLLFGDVSGDSNSGENARRIIEIADGGYLVVGKAEISDTVGTDIPLTDRTRGSNIWTMKLDENLTPIWSRSYGSSQDDDSNCVVETEKGFVIAGTIGTIDGDATPKAGYTGKSAWVFMIDKNSGDIIWDEVHGGSGDDSFSFLFADQNGDILLGGNSTSNDADLAGKNKGSRDAWFLKLNGQTGESLLPPDSAPVAPPPAPPTPPTPAKKDFIYLQVGPNSGNHFQIDFADMRTSAVFGENAVLDVMSHEAAGNTISLCDRAIDYVSKQRSLYGSYQNALEHLYGANAITGENVSASESRVADADIANETVEFSRSKILEQVNTAIMAQANTATESVLKLL